MRVAIVGGGPAGLMAAEVLSAANIEVDLYESKGSVGRKFLIAGKGGLNLTHSESFEQFVARYGSQAPQVRRWLEIFDANAIREWAKTYGVETFIGTSGRVFPNDMKAAPLLRAWVRRLRERGVRFHVNHRCIGIDANRTLHFQTPYGAVSANADAVIFALGGASWPQLGSIGDWVTWLAPYAEIAPLQSANCGFDVAWSKVFAQRFAGAPVKTVVIHFDDSSLQGEFVVSENGVEGSAIYALSSSIRGALSRRSEVVIHLDLLPQKSRAEIQHALSVDRKGRTWSEHLRRTVGVEGVKAGLLYEVLPKEKLEPTLVAETLKSLPLKLLRPRPIAEAISTAGGVKLEALDEHLMLRSMRGVFCAGEMLDWEAPTGGYLLTACFASGRVAALGVLQWMQNA